MITAEILATGDEIRSGTLIDSNSAHVAQQLELSGGVGVTRHHSVGDDIQALAAILREIAERADIAVVTGGLGPTSDDLTAEAAAQAAGVSLRQSPEALELVEAFFRKFHKPISPSNLKQSYFPEGASCIVNPIGSAPGFMMSLKKCLFFFLPGVPAEMRRMLSDTVLPVIIQKNGKNRLCHRVVTLNTFGLTESMTGEMLREFSSAFPAIQLGFRAKFPEIQVKFYLHGEDERQITTMAQQAEAWVSDKLGHHLFSSEGDPMEVVVGRLLSQQKATVALAESCTGGQIAAWLTDVPGCSDYFLFSGVVYANQAKMNVLSVPENILLRYGAVHEETVKHMAIGTRRITGATYGLATSGIAGPGGGTDEKPVGVICIGLATPDAVHAYRFHYRFKSRQMNKQIFAMKALDILRRELMGIEHQ